MVRGSWGQVWSPEGVQEENLQIAIVYSILIINLKFWKLPATNDPHRGGGGAVIRWYLQVFAPLFASIW